MAEAIIANLLDGISPLPVEVDAILHPPLLLASSSILGARRPPTKAGHAEMGTPCDMKRHGTGKIELARAHVNYVLNCSYTCPMQHPHYPSTTLQKRPARQPPISILDGMLSTA